MSSNSSGTVCRAWRYLLAAFGARTAAELDPRIQIEVAVKDARSQHSALIRQAAAVIGTQRQIEISLSKAINEVETHAEAARKNLRLAQIAHAGGNNIVAGRYEAAAAAAATALVAAETQMESLHELERNAASATAAARAAVESNARRVQTALNERDRLLTQLETARMSEHLVGQLESVLGSGAPEKAALESARESIEARYAHALAMAELANSSVESHQREIETSLLDENKHNQAGGESS